MININIILGILFTHWFADFVLQTDWEAKNKSSNNIALFSHVFHYSIVWLALPLLYGAFTYKENSWFYPFFLFAFITFVCHFITDYITSRINKRLWEQQKVHLFFVSIGFDQFLHYLQLFLTYQLLK